MTIEKIPFRKYDTKENPADIITIRLNESERKQLQDCKILIQQPKDSTALKTLAEIGANVVLHDYSIRVFLETLFKNKANNERLGVPIESPTFNTNVTQN